MLVRHQPQQFNIIWVNYLRIYPTLIGHSETLFVEDSRQCTRRWMLGGVIIHRQEILE